MNNATAPLPETVTITISKHENVLLQQAVAAQIKDVMMQKERLSAMTNNYEDSSSVMDYYCKRHKMLIELNKALLAQM